jgi:integral membrane sensor domain MASE1
MTTSPHATVHDTRPAQGALRGRVIPRPLAIVVEALAIYLAYTALGELNRQFTPPPAGISPIWLPAGFAVGVVLVRGMWTAIPLFLTGVVNTVRADLYLTDPVSQGGYGLEPLTLAWAAFLYGLAVAGHCVVAKLLVDHLIRDRSYDGVMSATAFLMFVGPVSCVLSGLLGTEVFRVEGFVDRDAFLVSSFTFWIGDAIACMVIAPVFVALAGGSEWRSRRAPIVVLSIGTMLIVIASTSLVGRTELDRIQQ